MTERHGTVGATLSKAPVASLHRRETAVSRDAMSGFTLYLNVSRKRLAKVAELVDAPDLGSGAERRVGSSPSFRTRSRPRSNRTLKLC